MKNIILNNIWTLAFLLYNAVFFNSCNKDEGSENFKENALPPKITKVYLEDVNSKVPDREVTFARIGQTIRLEGENFLGISKVYLNGYDCTFNPTYISNSSMIVQIANKVPTTDAADDVRNTIRVEKISKSCNCTTQFYIHNFEFRSAAPSITSISHTMPLAGESITIYGTGLVEIESITFPGNIVVTKDIVSDNKEGKWVTVTVPNGIPESGGSLFIKGANGGVYSPAYFNCKNGLILDFDGHGEPAGWTANAITSADFLDAVIGEGNVSQGKYCPLTPDKFLPISSGVSRATEVWTTGNESWRAQFVPNIFATSTPVNKIAVQFDIYVPNEWNHSGFLGLNLVNNFDAGNQWTGEFYNYIPWLAGKEKVPFKTKGWITVTAPLNEFYKYAKGSFTFEDILQLRETANYKNFGIFFNNNDFTLANITGNDTDKKTEFISSDTFIKVYVDNFRLVSLEAPTFSDFPDEE
ncbi:MAG: glycan-binding surface protein [Dysgonamonadaceae bacterium]|jgi:hypothetical protein|nr:glycan-binding surface protein [Dysgonamonadaceae bacterium]